MAETARKAQAYEGRLVEKGAHVDGSILIVDDDDDTSLLEESLRKRCFDMRTADSGDAALELLRSWRVDVVVTDVQMPGLTGIELNDVMLVALFGYGNNTDVEAALSTGFDAVTKPAEFNKLEEILARKRPTTEEQ